MNFENIKGPSASSIRNLFLLHCKIIMQFTSVLSQLSLLALATAALEFGLLVIRSGSIYQYSTITQSGDNLVVGSSQDYMVRLNDDGSVSTVDGSKYLSINDANQYVFGSKKTTGYSLSNGHLSGPGDFLACPATDGTVYLSSKCDAGLGIALRAVGLKDVSSTTTTPSTTSTKKPATSSKPSTLVTKRSSSTSSAASASATAGTFAGKRVQVSCKGCSIDKKNVTYVDSHPHVFAVGGSQGTAVQLTLFSNTTMVDGTGRGINVDSSTGEVGLVNPWGTEAATKQFSNAKGMLAYKGNTTFYACPSGGDTPSLSVKKCTGGDSVQLTLI